MGLFIGLFLGGAAIWLRVQTNEKEEAVLELLPGNNCGGCGYPGCSGLAAAIAAGEAPCERLSRGREAEVGKKIAAVMGVEAEESERMVAFVQCRGTKDQVKLDYEYNGVKDCRMLSFVPNGGAKSCGFGCLGYGSCEQVCPFDAIHVFNGRGKSGPGGLQGLRKMYFRLPEEPDHADPLFRELRGGLQLRR